MTQRIFDMENESDVTDLFDILPDSVNSIRPYCLGMYSTVLDEGIGDNLVTKLFNIRWGNKTSVDRPVDKSKWIGALCWFWVKDKDLKVIGELGYISMGYFYRNLDHTPYSNCEPVKRSEIKFVEDMEE